MKKELIMLLVFLIGRDDWYFLNRNLVLVDSIVTWKLYSICLI